MSDPKQLPVPPELIGNPLLRYCAGRRAGDFNSVNIMQTQIQYTYNETVITYDESRNRWLYVLRGREKSSESLALAKEAIDKPAPKTAKPFNKIDAWLVNYSTVGEKVTVTAIAEPDYRGRPSVWIKREDGRRTKETVDFTIYPANEKNDAIIAAIAAKNDEIEKAKEEITRLKATLQPLTIQTEE